MATRVGRGDVRLYQFAPPDKNRPMVMLRRSDWIRVLKSDSKAGQSRNTLQNTRTLKVRYFLGFSRTDFTSCRVSISI
jgi:hypothetical protein